MATRSTATFAVLTLLAAGLMGCGTGSTGGSGGSGTGSGGDGGEGLKLTRAGVSPASDDTLLIYYGDDPDTLNLITSNDTVSTAFQREVYEGLAEQSFADPDKWLPSLATSWEFDPDTLTFTIHLRKGVYWHPMNLPDGTPLPRTEFTASDVLFTFDCILNEGIEATSLRSYFTNPEAEDPTKRVRIEVNQIDDYTVTVKWNEPYFLATEFTLGMYIMPEHVYGVDEHGEPISLDYRDSREFADAFNKHWANTKMCGTGPLIFREWKKEQEATLDRNPDYWGSPYYFSKVVYRHIANPNTALQKILQNELDWAAIPQKDHFMQSKTHENVVSGKVKLVDYEYPGFRYMGFNQKRELFKDRNVRWAITHCVPVDQIIDKIYNNLAAPLTGPFLPGSSACDESISRVPYDLDKARQLLDEAGWKDTDSDGVLDKVISGQKVAAKFDLMIYADSPQYRQVAEIIRENCRRVGIDVIITPTKWALMLEKLRSKEFDACILGWALNWKGDPFQIWHGSQADIPDSSNSIGYRNADLDKLIDELRVTMDEEKQVELYHKIHRIIYDDQPYTFLFMDRATAGYDARLENISYYKIRPCYDTREWTASSARVLAP